jgi:hypothetical protein
VFFRVSPRNQWNTTMLTAALFAAALLLDGGQVAVIAGPAAPAETRPADAPEGLEGTTRRVCSFERATGSNMQQRVCRNVSRSRAQDQQTREFMRSMQQPRLPDREAATTPGGPNG